MRFSVNIMVDVPEPGTGSVSLNMADAVPAEPAPINETFALGSDEPAQATAPVSTEPTEMPELDVADEANAMAIPVVDAAQQSSVDVADLDLESTDEPTNGLFAQRNVKIWIIVLSVAVVVLVSVFFLLARQTNLFQGTLVTSLGGDEPIIGAPAQPTVATPPETPTTPPPATTLPDPTDDEPLVGTTSSPVIDDGTESVVNDNASALLEGIIGYDEDIIPDGGPITSDPEFDDVIITADPQPSAPIIGEGAFPVGPTTGFGDPTTLPPPTAPLRDVPTLASTTDAGVLASANVQGNTGPGVILYFVPPFLAYLVKRRRVRKA